MTPRRLLRAALLGFACALILGGLWVFFSGVRARIAAPTETLTANEQQLEAEVRRASRLQLVGGAGLTLLGVGALLWQREAAKRQGNATSQPERGHDSA